MTRVSWKGDLRIAEKNEQKKQEPQGQLYTAVYFYPRPYFGSKVNRGSKLSRFTLNGGLDGVAKSCW
jgi:hypothetical protein